MLKFMNSSREVLASGPPASGTEVVSLQEHFGAVPADYLQLVSEATEIELRHANGQYVRIWGPVGCIEMNEGYGIRRRIPGAVPIGDDGGGNVIFYQKGKQGFGLYHLGYGNLDGDAAIWIAPTLTHFLTRCVGIESF